MSDNSVSVGEDPSSSRQEKFVDRIWNKMIRVVEEEVKHPHLQELAAGTLPIEKFKFQAKQNYKYLLEYAKALAIGLAKSQDFETMQRLKSYLLQIMDVEIPFYSEYCKNGLGIGLDELEGTLMANIKRSYTSHELARAWEGDLAELIAAILPCDLCYWEVAKRLSKICRLPKGNIYREWIDLYTSEAFSRVSEDAITFINGLCEKKKDDALKRIEEIFLVSCEYELLSWDMYYNRITWPLPQVFI